MKVQTTCPHCQATYMVLETAVGRTAHCKQCGQPFTVLLRSGAEVPPPPSPPPPEAVEEIPLAPAPAPPSSAPEPAPAVPAPGPAAPAEGAGQAGGGRSAGGAAPVVDHLIDALASALRLRKLGVALVGGLLTLAFVYVLALMGPQMEKAAGVVGVVSLMVMMVVVVFGALGILAGIVARMAHQESQGRTGGLGEALVFCARRSLDLASGMVIVALAIGMASVAVNLGIGQLRRAGEVGDLFAAMLFLPQLLFNVLAVFVLLVGVLVPCAIAVEDIGMLRAFLRLVGTFRRRTATLVVQVGVTYLFGSMLTAVLALLLMVGLLPTLAGNAPGHVPEFLGDISEAYFGSVFRSQPLAAQAVGFRPGRRGDADVLEEFSREFRPRPRRSYSSSYPYRPRPVTRRPPTRVWEWFRLLPVGFCYAMLVVYPLVFWVCSFTRFHESVLPAVSPPSRPGPPSRSGSPWAQ